MITEASAFSPVIRSPKTSQPISTANRIDVSRRADVLPSTAPGTSPVRCATCGGRGAIDLLGELAQVESIRYMPSKKFFKIGVDLDVKGDRAPNAKKAKREPELAAPDA